MLQGAGSACDDPVQESPRLFTLERPDRFSPISARTVQDGPPRR